MLLALACKLKEHYIDPLYLYPALARHSDPVSQDTYELVSPVGLSGYVSYLKVDACHCNLCTP